MTVNELNNVMQLYINALVATKASYLQRLKQETIAEQESEKIWNASLILQFMSVSYGKYAALLKFLIDNNIEAILATVSQKISAYNSVTPPHEVLEQFQLLIENEAFMAELQELIDTYEKKEAILTLVQILSIPTMIAMMAPIAVFAPFLQVIIPVALILGLICAFVCSYAIFEIDSLDGKKRNLNNLITDLSDFTKALEYSGKEEYRYESEDGKNGIKKIITLEKTHEPLGKSELRQNFFKPALNESQALCGEVQNKYDELGKNQKIGA